MNNFDKNNLEDFLNSENIEKFKEGAEKIRVVRDKANRIMHGVFTGIIIIILAITTCCSFLPNGTYTFTEDGIEYDEEIVDFEEDEFNQNSSEKDYGKNTIVAITTEEFKNIVKNVNNEINIEDVSDTF